MSLFQDGDDPALGGIDVENGGIGKLGVAEVELAVAEAQVRECSVEFFQQRVLVLLLAKPEEAKHLTTSFQTRVQPRVLAARVYTFYAPEARSRTGVATLTGFLHQPRRICSVADAARDGNVIIRKVMEEKGRAGKVKIIFADAGGDPLRREKDLERLVKKGAGAGGGAQFVDPGTAARMVRRLKEAGVKVVALDTLVPDAPLDACVAPDQARSGELLAQFVRENLPDGGGAPARALFLDGDPDNPGMEAVAAAFREFLAVTRRSRFWWRIFPGLSPVWCRPFMEGIFVRYGNAVNAVAAADSRLAVAAIEVLCGRALNRRPLATGGPDAGSGARACSQAAGIFRRPLKRGALTKWSLG